MQGTEINRNLDYNLLSFAGYNIETENNSECSRIAFYISNKINYVRRSNLEGLDSNIIILDLISPTNVTSSKTYYACYPKLIKLITEH